MPKFVGERELRVWLEEDSGQTRIAHFDLMDDHDELGIDQEDGIFVRLYSWDETKVHADWEQLKNKRIRVTVEIV